MAYVEPDQVRLVLARDPGQPSGTAAALDDTHLAAAIADAQAEIDAHLRGRYTVPFDPAPQLIQAVTVGLAAWSAALVFFQEQEFPADTGIQLRYQWARDTLSALRDGTVDLDISDNTGPGGFGTPINIVPAGLLTDPAPGWCW